MPPYGGTPPGLVATGIAEQTSPAAGNLPLVINADLPRVVVGIPLAMSDPNVSPYVTEGSSPLLVGPAQSPPVMTTTPAPIPVSVVGPVALPAGVTVVPTVTPPNTPTPPPSVRAPGGWVYGTDIAGTWGGFVPNGSFTDYEITMLIDKAQSIFEISVISDSGGRWSTKDRNYFAVVVLINGTQINSDYTDNLGLKVQAGDIVTVGFEGLTMARGFGGSFTVALSSNLGVFPFQFGRNAPDAPAAPAAPAASTDPCEYDRYGVACTNWMQENLGYSDIETECKNYPSNKACQDYFLKLESAKPQPYGRRLDPSERGFAIEADRAGTWNIFGPNGATPDYRIDWPIDHDMIISDVYVSTNGGYWSTSNPSAYPVVVLLNGQQINSAYKANLMLPTRPGDILTLIVDSGPLRGNIKQLNVKLTMVTAMGTPAGEMNEIFDRN